MSHRRHFDFMCLLGVPKTGTLFMTADGFAVASLILPYWIVSDVGGKTSVGLLITCMTIYGRPEICYSPQPLRVEWMLVFLCIAIGILFVSVTSILLVISHWRQKVYLFAKWLGFASIIAFCIAAVLFPIGFDADHIGGMAYQLPNSYRVGISYIFFVLALWITVISEIFASKVCLPRLEVTTTN